MSPGRALLLGSVVDGVCSYVTTGTSVAQPCAFYSKWAVFVQSDGNTISAGTLTIEEADYDPSTGPGYGGAWSAITTIDLTALDGAIGQTAYHSPVAAFGFVRVRLSADVTGGGGVVVSFRGRE